MEQVLKSNRDESGRMQRPPNVLPGIIEILGRLCTSLPLYSCGVSAGFPSPADDHMECTLDLHKHVVQHPQATFFVRAAGDSMIGAGIFDGDILVVDRSLAPKHGNVVIALAEGHFTVKTLHINGVKQLKPENPNHAPIPILDNSDIEIWGVVSYVLHRLL